MLQRNLVYTGVTRGKRRVLLVGQRKALAIAIKEARHGSDGRIGYLLNSQSIQQPRHVIFDVQLELAAGALSIHPVAMRSLQHQPGQIDQRKFRAKLSGEP
jgi:hypothetical protein